MKRRRPPVARQIVAYRAEYLLVRLESISIALVLCNFTKGDDDAKAITFDIGCCITYCDHRHYDLSRATECNADDLVEFIMS